MLHSLEINGFKSFAKKSNLDFSARISAIVGPNGSGKSNVAEAFRFVLGEQSIKSLRGKRGEDLIFSGSVEAGRLNRASVKLIFNNTSRVLPIDFDEVTIERVVHRDSANEYFINNTLVRLKDVSELLASAHIGASGHHIISQGEADRILNANTKERREMIEDALGLKIYQYKKQESERKLEKTRENMERVASLRREIAPHIRFLKKQVEKIEKGRELRDQLVALYQTYFAREESYVKAEKRRIEEAMIAPRKELDTVSAELEAARNTIKASQKEDPALKELESIEQEMRIIESQSRADMLDFGRIEGEIISIERLIKKQEEAAVRAHADDSLRVIPFREARLLCQDITQEADSILEKDARGDVSIDMWRDVIGGITHKVKHFVSRFEQSQNSAPTFDTDEVQSYRDDIAELLIKKQKSLDERTIREKTLREIQERRDVLVRAIEESKTETIEAERTIFSLMSRQNELHSIINGLQSEHNRLILEQEDYERELKEAAALIGLSAIHFTPEPFDENAFYDADLRARLRTEQHESRRMLEKMKIRLEEMGGAGGEEVVKEYTEAEERDAFLLKELEDLEKSSASLTHLISELDETLNTEFKNGIAKINREFQSLFTLMFGGGHASLSLVREDKRAKNSLDESLEEDRENAVEKDTTEGIDIAVNLPNKKVKSLMMLSGGERSLTSVALLFALSQVNPPPFIILDETDAALDEANSRKYGDMIENLSKVSQLIVITHNRETMSRADIIYGVTMRQGASQLLSIRFDQALAVAK